MKTMFSHLKLCNHLLSYPMLCSALLFHLIPSYYFLFIPCHDLFAFPSHHFLSYPIVCVACFPIPSNHFLTHPILCSALFTIPSHPGHPIPANIFHLSISLCSSVGDPSRHSAIPGAALRGHGAAQTGGTHDLLLARAAGTATVCGGHTEGDGGPSLPLPFSNHALGWSPGEDYCHIWHVTGNTRYVCFSCYNLLYYTLSFRLLFCITLLNCTFSLSCSAKFSFEFCSSFFLFILLDLTSFICSVKY